MTALLARKADKQLSWLVAAIGAPVGCALGEALSGGLGIGLHLRYPTYRRVVVDCDLIGGKHYPSANATVEPKGT